MQRAKLILLQPGFEDPAYSRSALLMLALRAPRRRARLLSRSCPAPQCGAGGLAPAAAVIALVGEEHQSLPLLVLADDAPDDLPTGFHRGRRFVDDKDAILRTLSLRHGFPEARP